MPESISIHPMKRALEMYRSPGNTKSIRAIAKECKVSKTSLIRRIKQKVNMKGEHDGRFHMGDLFESYLEAYIVYSFLRNTPLSCKAILKLASDMIGVDNISSKWLRGFTKRSHFLEQKVDSNLFQFELTDGGKCPLTVFKHYASVFNLTDDYIWSLTENCFAFGDGTKENNGITLIEENAKEAPDSREISSTYEIISKAGAVGYPLVVFKAPRTMYNGCETVGEKEVSIAKSQSGYINADIFNRWINGQFLTKDSRETNDKWSMVILDDQEFCMSDEIIRNLFQQRTVPLYFPIKITSMLKSSNQKAHFTQTEPCLKPTLDDNKVKIISRHEESFIDIYLTQREKAFSPQPILEAWEKYGLPNSDNLLNAIKEYQEKEEKDKYIHFKYELEKLHQQGKDAILRKALELKQQLDQVRIRNEQLEKKLAEIDQVDNIERELRDIEKRQSN